MACSIYLMNVGNYQSLIDFGTFLQIWGPPNNKKERQGKIQPRHREWTETMKGTQNLVRRKQGWRAKQLTHIGRNKWV